MKRAYCPRDDRDKHLRFLKAGKRGGNIGYVKSLNYLPNAADEETVEDLLLDPSLSFCQRMGIVFNNLNG
jgi:hypothetical protein